MSQVKCYYYPLSNILNVVSLITNINCVTYVSVTLHSSHSSSSSAQEEEEEREIEAVCSLYDEQGDGGRMYSKNRRLRGKTINLDSPCWSCFGCDGSESEGCE